MPLIKYVHKSFRATKRRLISQANVIMTDYRAQGFDLTLRQLYYQFVARGLLPNTEKSYKNLGKAVNDGRLAGMIDWTDINDRTRKLNDFSAWDSPQDIIKSAARSFAMKVWDKQPEYVEVWVEKEALIGVAQQACDEMRVPSFACRGYVSQSAMWEAARRMIRRAKEGPMGYRHIHIVHLGDHDPSGIDMTRDIEARIETFEVEDFEVERIALNMDQIDDLNPPPNPAKITDSRAAEYIARFGCTSWELDAISPQAMVDLIQDTIAQHVDETAMGNALVIEQGHRQDLAKIADDWKEVVARYHGDAE